MKVWIIIVSYKKLIATKVSQQAYRTIEEAQQFCEERCAKKIRELLYENENFVYQITDVNILCIK